MNGVNEESVHNHDKEEFKVVKCESVEAKVKSISVNDAAVDVVCRYDVRSERVKDLNVSAMNGWCTDGEINRINNTKEKQTPAESCLTMCVNGHEVVGGEFCTSCCSIWDESR